MSQVAVTRSACCEMLVEKSVLHFIYLVFDNARSFVKKITALNLVVARDKIKE